MEENQFFDKFRSWNTTLFTNEVILELYDTFLKYQHMVQIQRKINSD